VDGAQQTNVQEVEHAPSNSVRTVAAVKTNATTNSTHKEDCITLSAEWTRPASCLYDTNALQALSYQAIMGAFNNLLIGYIGDAVNGETGIYNTKLIDNTKELSYLAPRLAGTVTTGSVANIQHVLLESNHSSVSGLAYQGTNGIRMPLRNALEELFQNITISMLSAPELQTNRSALGLANTNVTITTEHNVYEYSSAKLLLAYGLAILLTIIEVVLGLYTMVVKHASFSNKFSSILRASRHAELDSVIDLTDQLGSDPLPRTLANATVQLPRKVTDRTSKHEGSYTRVSQVDLVEQVEPAEERDQDCDDHRIRKRSSMSLHRRSAVRSLYH